jgi:hypothetical protein
MRKKILAGATVLALATGVTANAMASDQKGGRSGSQVGRIHAGKMHSFRATHGSRFAGATPRHDGWEDGSPYQRGYKDLGPLGFTLGCGRGTCQGFSVSAWSY